MGVLRDGRGVGLAPCADMKPRRNSKSRSQPGSSSQVGIEWGLNFLVTTIEESPRKTAIWNILLVVLTGIIMGFGLFLVTSIYTSQFHKAWTYAANTVIAMVIRLVLQWMIVVRGVPFARLIARRVLERRTGRRVPRVDGKLPETTIANNLTVTVVATLILATELSGGGVQPLWFVDASDAIWIVPLMGGVTAALEMLSLPSNIQALAKNIHSQQTTSTQPRRERRSARKRSV